MRLLKILGSLPFALFLIAGLVVLLSVSTVMESVYGTPFAQKVFYTATWFDVILGLVWVNIFCSTLTRIPFKKHHTGFVITHIGILLLLSGALITRLHGQEGHMTLFEKESKNKIVTTGYVLDLRSEGSTHVVLSLNEKKNPLPRRWEMNSGTAVTALRALPHARLSRMLVEGEGSSASNPAVQASIKSEMLGIEESVILISDNPHDAMSAAAQVGPAHFLLKKKASAASTPVLKLIRKNGESFSVPVVSSEMEAIPLGKSGLFVSFLRYFPAAKVRDNRIVDAPEEVGSNPAVEFEVRDAKGRSERHTRFVLFPDFGSLKGGEAADVFGLTVRLEVPQPPAEETSFEGPAFVFYADPDGKWSYRVNSSKGISPETPLKIGEPVVTGWMDIAVTPKLFFHRATVADEVKADESGSWAVELLIEKNGAEDRRWIFADQALEAGGVKVSLEAKSVPVPFSLALKDFRKVDYPGTSKPASFESDVELTDAGVKIDRTIQMNRPLDYKGYRIFQSSYIQDPSFGEASVFTVAKNPGIRLTYGGAAVILLGVLILFYLHPFFNPSVRIPDEK